MNIKSLTKTFNFSSIKLIMAIMTCFFLTACNEAEFAKGTATDALSTTEGQEGQVGQITEPPAEYTDAEKEEAVGTYIPVELPEEKPVVVETPAEESKPEEVVTPEPAVTVAPEPIIERVTQMFGQNEENKGRSVDIIWVVDSSGSMGGEQADLERNFGKFIESFTDSNLESTTHFANFEYRMGVIDTGPRYVRHDNRDNFKIKLGTFYSMGLIDRNSNAPIYNHLRLDKATSVDQLTDFFAKDIKLGTRGSWLETGTGAALAAMLRGMTAEQRNSFDLTNAGKALLLQSNKDFFREDAELHFIIVTDEEDCLVKSNRYGGCQNPDYYSIYNLGEYHYLKKMKLQDHNNRKDEFANAMLLEMRKMAKVLKPQIYADILKDNPSRDLIIHSITKTSSSTSSNGVFYRKLSEMTGGTQANISEDFAEILSGIGETIYTKLEKNFTLKCTPIIDTDKPLIVSYSFPGFGIADETIVNSDSYSVNGNTVIFDKGVEPPPASSTIKITAFCDVTNMPSEK